MELVLRSCRVRSWEERDAASITEHGDNIAVWRNMRDAFPRPFTLERARAFIEAARAAPVETRFAICVGDEAVGGIGFGLHQDIERVSAELGYWLGERFWGRGIASEAIAAVTAFAIDAYSLTRVYAVPFATNPASARALEKVGYVLEGRMRRAVIKEGVVLDQLLYAFVPPG
jgi:ribosomal-protein-alanine N-acetyltransferase